MAKSTSSANTLPQECLLKRMDPSTALRSSWQAHLPHEATNGHHSPKVHTQIPKKENVMPSITLPESPTQLHPVAPNSSFPFDTSGPSMEGDRLAGFLLELLALLETEEIDRAKSIVRGELDLLRLRNHSSVYSSTTASSASTPKNRRMGGRKGHSVSPRQRRNEPERRKRLSLGNIGSLATSGSFRKRRSSKGMSVTLDTSPVNADSPTGHSEEESDYFRGRASSLFVPCLPIPARDENSAPEMISPRSASPRSDSLISPRPASASPTSPSISPRPGGGSRVKFSSHPPQKTEAGDVQNRRKRTIEEQEQYELVREELLDTERSYVHDLRILLEVYKQPLEERKIIPKETCQELFRNVEALLPLNEELLNQMESIRKQSPSLRGKMPPERPSRCMPVDVRPTPNAQQSVISVKVEKESTVKSILVDNTTTVREAVDIVLDRLAWDSEERLLQLQSDYAFCILVDHTTRRVCDSDKPLLPQLSPPAESGGHPLVVLKRSVKDVTDLGECFMQLGVYLKMYSEYCNNQPAASKLYAELIEENDAFYHFIEECREKEVVRNLDLEAFLILPLQRLCKYPLFLKQLIQLTPHLHPSYQSLQSALEVIENAVSATDSRKHEMEVSQMMWDLQNRIKGNIKFQIFAPHRRFICKGPVQYFIPRDNSINSLGHYYLFSDLLVVTSREEKGKQSRLIFQTQVADIVHCVEDTKYSVKVTSLTKEHPRAPATRCSIILIFPEENLKAQFHSSMEEQENAHAAAHLSAHRSPSGIPSVESRRPTIGKRRPPMPPPRVSPRQAPS